MSNLARMRVALSGTPNSWMVVWGTLVVVATLGSARAPDSFEGPRSVERPRLLSTTDVEPIAQVRRDDDGDFVPDRVGDTVTVRGRASVRHGIHPDSNLVFLQDGTGGIAVEMTGSPSIQRGDSVQASGVVRHRNGLTRLDAFQCEQFEAEAHVPSPVPLTVATATGEAYEGRLVRVRGYVTANRSNDGGQYLLLQDEADNASTQLMVFVPTRRGAAIPLQDYEVGEEVIVTGILGQYDYSDPHDEYYQVLPRESDDVRSAGGISTYIKTLIVVLVACGLLAVLTVLSLRVAVKRRTQQLDESRARFRRLAEATFEGIFLHEDGEILDVNQALTDMIGYDREELVGREFEDVLSESTRDLVRDAFEECPDEPYEAVMVRRDGATFPAEIEEKAIDHPDSGVRVAAIRDITERKKRETELVRAKEEAEQMAKLKSNLLNTMSHELRTPVTSIIGYAELIMDEPETAPEAFAARIEQSGKRLSRTLQSVIDLAQIQSGALEVQPRDVKVGMLVHEVVEGNQPFGDEDDLSFEVRVADAVETLYTDRALMRRILDNLVHNAVKFTEEGTIHVTVVADGPDVKVAVRDPGIGIDPDFREHLFEPFEQESQGRTRTHEGTGLGLALTKRIVDLLGGTIEVESVKGEGSTFVVKLSPLVPSEKTKRAAVDLEGA